jgi:hypothetical protein
MKPSYFDLTVRDLEAAQRFLTAVLGWELEPFGPAYLRIRAGSPDEPGIDGGVGRVADAPLARGQPMTIVTLPVADLDGIMRLVEAHGGTVVERRTPIPGIGWFSACAEPGGSCSASSRPTRRRHERARRARCGRYRPSLSSFLCRPSRVMPSVAAVRVLLPPWSRSASLMSQRST